MILFILYLCCCTISEHECNLSKTMYQYWAMLSNAMYCWDVIHMGWCKYGNDCKKVKIFQLWLASKLRCGSRYHWGRWGSRLFWYLPYAYLFLHLIYTILDFIERSVSVVGKSIYFLNVEIVIIVLHVKI